MCCKDKSVIKLKYTGSYSNPKFSTKGSAGIDLRNELEDIEIRAGAISETIHTGVYVEIPAGYVGLIYVRSSIGFKRGLTLVNSVGVIDSDYRGEICAKLINNSGENFTLERGERFCQLVVVPCVGNIEYVDELDSTERGENGYGSTGRW